jgi:hypothetical protein
LANSSTSVPPFASITRREATFIASVVSSTYGSPSRLTSGSSSASARVAYPHRRFQG